MDYAILSPDKKVYIRLDECGRPVTCAKSNAQHFEYSKAKNIVNSLPRTMKRFRFTVEAIPEIAPPKEEDEIIVREEWNIPEGVVQWVERVNQVSTLMKDARQRKKELSHDLSNADKQIINLRHEVRLGKPLNACEGYKKYREWKSLEERRGDIKDELFGVTEILNCDMNDISDKKMKNIISALRDRVFEIREEEPSATPRINPGLVKAQADYPKP